jgi:hypothetical protein
MTIIEHVREEEDIIIFIRRQRLSLIYFALF